MGSIVFLSKNARKDLNKLPRHIKILFEFWMETIEEQGYPAMQRIKGYRDHSFKGTRQHERSSSLSRSWRIIYELNEKTNSITL